MEIICTGCNTKLNIPDEKLPKDQVVRINCPKCKTRLTVEPQVAWELGFNRIDMDQYAENGRLKYVDDREGMKKSAPAIEDMEDEDRKSVV
jgi:hypothetical protein